MSLFSLCVLDRLRKECGGGGEGCLLAPGGWPGGPATTGIRSGLLNAAYSEHIGRGVNDLLTDHDFASGISRRIGIKAAPNFLEGNGHVQITSLRMNGY